MIKFSFLISFFLLACPLFASYERCENVCTPTGVYVIPYTDENGDPHNRTLAEYIAFEEAASLVSNYTTWHWQDESAPSHSENDPKVYCSRTDGFNYSWVFVEPYRSYLLFDVTTTFFDSLECDDGSGFNADDTTTLRTQVSGGMGTTCSQDCTMVMECPPKRQEKLEACQELGGDCLEEYECIETPAPMVPVVTSTCGLLNSACNDGSLKHMCYMQCGGAVDGDINNDFQFYVNNFLCSYDQACGGESHSTCVCSTSEIVGISQKKQYQDVQYSNTAQFIKSLHTTKARQKTLSKIAERIKTMKNQKDKVLQRSKTIILKNGHLYANAKTGIVTAFNNVTTDLGDNVTVNMPTVLTEAELTKLKKNDEYTLSGGSADCSESPTCTGGNVACATAIINWRSDCIAINTPAGYTAQSVALQNDIIDLLPHGSTINKLVVNVADNLNIGAQSDYQTTAFDNIANPLLPDDEDAYIDLRPFREILSLAGVFVLLSAGITFLFYFHKTKERKK